MTYSTFEMPKDAKSKRTKRIPPYCGIKTKVGGFRKEHPFHTASEADMPEMIAGVWLPRLNQDSFEQVIQVTVAGFMIAPDLEGRPGNTKILCPRCDQWPDLTDT